MKAPILTPLAASLPSTVPFTGPETQERRQGHPFIARLGANESLFGPSPAAIKAMQSAASEAWMYGDPETHALKAALAQHHGCRPQNIVAGEGIDGLLGYLARLLVEPGTPVVTSLGAYPTFNFHVAGYGGTLHRAPYNGDHEDPDALLNLARQTQARMLYLANPDNPMGSHHPGETISDLLANLPEPTLLVLDEAYIDLAPEGTAPEIPADTPNLIRFRTFSKAHGLAGLRVGYAITSAPLATAFDKVRNHFGLGRIAQAGALAALHDQAYLTEIRAKTATARTRLSAIARANGLIPLPSATNFITMDCTRDGNYARRVLAELLTRGIFVRMPGVAPLDRCIRVSLGDEAALAAFQRALPEALKAAG
ncbi:pyridoxal phosphate-dependent aminotransferase [Cypionkella sp.]|uniref:pyridoxal phosphate-dependent aminotransferase n=1 Tax=Cypionkella sp. TaxID=2811411 RepID=UPI0026176B34|nr:pyridoxal phosphate-dependent aminotransferase [Cypionkella sp.]MDB5665006.1 pyridoxal phosphate-dependent aminotransferase [Cypionkella sp.]